MTVTTPTPAVLSKGAGLRVIDYAVDELPACQASAEGLASVTSGYVDTDKLWRIERITVAPGPANSATLGQIAVYASDDMTPQRGRDWTPYTANNYAVSEYPSYLTIKPGIAITIAIVGVAPGDE